MSIQVTTYGDVVVLTAKDELTHETAPTLMEKAEKSLHSVGPRVVVDCSTLHGIDSAGLEALVDLQDRCEEQLGTVKLCGLDQTCAKILAITRLARRFETFVDLESAVKSFV